MKKNAKTNGIGWNSKAGRRPSRAIYGAIGEMLSNALAFEADANPLPEPQASTSPSSTLTLRSGRRPRRKSAARAGANAVKVS